MNPWQIMTDVFSEPLFQSFLISVGASASWDAVKKYVSQKKLEKSFEYLYYKAIAQTFELFYEVNHLEYNEKIVMDAFLEQIKSIENFDSSNISRKILKNTIGFDIGEDCIVGFPALFVSICARDEYEIIYRKIILEKIVCAPKEKDHEWMQTYMQDNCCKISFHVFENLIPALKDVKTKLDGVTWNDIQGLLWEVAYNAQLHGKANVCKLMINSDSIVLMDNGEKFNCLSLKKKEIKGGGGMSMHVFAEKYPTIKTRYEYKNRENKFIIKFISQTFDVNDMSEIILPSLIIPMEMTKLYPDAEFKYYFVDIGTTIEMNNNATYSSFSSIFRIMGYFHSLLKSDFTKKIYVYFGDVSDKEILNIYNNFARVLKTNILDIKQSVVLLPEEV